MTMTTIDRTSTVASRVADGIFALLSRMAGAGLPQANRSLRSLSANQLRDAGIDLSVVYPGPVVPVDAMTMSTLMSLR